MKILILTSNEIEGTHYWKNAQPPVEYLKYPHRHLFEIKCEFVAKHDDRDIEIIMMQHAIQDYIKNTYGEPACFEEMSCEMIARDILKIFKRCISCTVLEDGKGGAKIIKQESI